MIKVHVVGSIVIRRIASSSLYELHVVYETTVVVVIVGAVRSVVLLIGSFLRRTAGSLRIVSHLNVLAPNAVARANAKLFNVAFSVIVVVLDQVAPRFLHRIVAGVLQLPAPVGEPVADLRVRESRLARQLFLLLSVRVRVLTSSHQPVLEHSFDFRRE